MPRTSDPPPSPRKRANAMERNHLLPGEAEAAALDAPAWIGVYEELLAFKQGLLVRAQEELAKLSPLAREDAMTDISLIIHQASRYRRRLSYWAGVLESADPVPD
jgi:hypothetical protein